MIFGPWLLRLEQQNQLRRQIRQALRADGSVKRSPDLVIASIDPIISVGFVQQNIELALMLIHRSDLVDRRLQG